jgi:hypothetical protein
VFIATVAGGLCCVGAGWIGLRSDRSGSSLTARCRLNRGRVSGRPRRHRHPGFPQDGARPPPGPDLSDLRPMTDRAAAARRFAPRSLDPEAALPESWPPPPRPETRQHDAGKQKDNDDHLCNPDISLSRIRAIVGGKHSTGNDETAHVRTEPPHHEPK